MLDEGKKFDVGKNRLDLLPWSALEQVGWVLTHGAAKYGAFNWERVENPQERYFAATLRHLSAWKRGEIWDEETKLNHLAHAACCLLFLLEKEGA